MINKAIVLGNLGRDPEVRNTQDGKPILNLSLATSERWKDRNSGERRERTEWHRVVVFDPIASAVRAMLCKGTTLYVEGKIQTRKWQDQSGQDRYSTEIVVSGPQSAVQIVKGGRDNRAPGNGQAHGDPGPGYQAPQGPSSPPPNDYDLDDDIPF